MFELLFWLYLVNAVLLITHEIDSAYWKEWELFKLLEAAQDSCYSICRSSSSSCGDWY